MKSDSANLLDRLKIRIGSFGKLVAAKEKLEAAKKSTEAKRNAIITAGKAAGQNAQSCLKSIKESTIIEVVGTAVNQTDFPLILSERHEPGDQNFLDELQKLITVTKIITDKVLAVLDQSNKVLGHQRRIKQDMATIQEKSA